MKNSRIKNLQKSIQFGVNNSFSRSRISVQRIAASFYLFDLIVRQVSNPGVDFPQKKNISQWKCTFVAGDSLKQIRVSVNVMLLDAFMKNSFTLCSKAFQ